MPWAIAPPEVRLIESFRTAGPSSTSSFICPVWFMFIFVILVFAWLFPAGADWAVSVLVLSGSIFFSHVLCVFLWSSVVQAMVWSV